MILTTKTKFSFSTGQQNSSNDNNTEQDPTDDYDDGPRAQFQDCNTIVINKVLFTK